MPAHIFIKAKHETIKVLSEFNINLKKDHTITNREIVINLFQLNKHTQHTAQHTHELIIKNKRES